MNHRIVHAPKRGKVPARPLWFLAALLIAAGSLGGCACQQGSDEECVLAAERRPFGRGFSEFFELAGKADDAVAEDFSRSSANLSRDASGLTSTWGHEVDSTWDLIAGVGPAIVGSFRSSAHELGGGVTSWYCREIDEVYCFVPRAWHSLKLLE